jgi:hypothetical protein
MFIMAVVGRVYSQSFELNFSKTKKTSQLTGFFVQGLNAKVTSSRLVNSKALLYAN